MYVCSGNVVAAGLRQLQSFKVTTCPKKCRAPSSQKAGKECLRGYNFPHNLNQYTRKVRTILPTNIYSVKREHIYMGEVPDDHARKHKINKNKVLIYRNSRNFQSSRWEKKICLLTLTLQSLRWKGSASLSLGGYMRAWESKVNF